MNIKEYALSGAQRICCSGTCISGYECGRAKDRYQLPLFNESFVCPLSKYAIDPNVTVEPHEFVNEDELFALCAECDNTGEVKVHKDGSMSVKRVDLTMCTDCIVKMIQESNAECAAEARMS